ncbi:MAG TPA: hypothetical protein VK948_00895 [Aeromicrobium sp.]|nr:hypothetical protein [Aeromicrobium sp.]
MTWRLIERLQVRRRAVLAGCCVDADGQPVDRGLRLALATVPDDGRRRPAHLRPGGTFFFLDVPAGRHALIRLDAGGAIAQTIPVVVPASDPPAKLPVVTVDFAVVDTKPAGRRRARSRTV